MRSNTLSKLSFILALMAFLLSVYQFFHNIIKLDISNVIQLLAILVSLITSGLSIAQSNKSIELTEKSIKDANRPYLVVYRDYIQIYDSIQEHTIIKNYGKTGATIDNLTFTPEFLDDSFDLQVFGNISNTFIAPGQCISTVSRKNTAKNKRDSCTAVISYHDTDTKYKNTFSLSEDVLTDLVFSKTDVSENHNLQDVISKSTEEILRRNL